ncbi:MAG TPA: phasin family protein [Gemmatimonadaceae bacterium]|nr:phasin family protein [Gemmatimonadaceae bacterium]
MRDAAQRSKSKHTPMWALPAWPRLLISERSIMSNSNQHHPVQQTPDSRQASFETALRIATITAEANEQLFKLQSDAANAAFAENAKQLRALLNTKDSGSVVTEWAGRYQANMRRILEVTRACFEIVPKTQAEMTRLVGERFAPYNKETQHYLDQFAAAITEGRDAAAAAVKDVLAKAMSGVSGSKPANKEKVA